MVIIGLAGGNLSWSCIVLRRTFYIQVSRAKLPCTCQHVNNEGRDAHGFVRSGARQATALPQAAWPWEASRALLRWDDVHSMLPRGQLLGTRHRLVRARRRKSIEQTCRYCSFVSMLVNDAKQSSGTDIVDAVISIPSVVGESSAVLGSTVNSFPSSFLLILAPLRPAPRRTNTVQMYLSRLSCNTSTADCERAAALYRMRSDL